MALTKISTGGVKDDAASQAKIADEAIDEARLQVSNAGTNGQFLQKSSGTGGLTWATATTDTSDKASLSGATFTGNISLGDNNITNVGEISLDTIKPDDGSNVFLNMGTDKNLLFQGDIGEIGDVTGFQATNDAKSANTSFGIRATDIRFATGSAERFRVGSSGQLGIAGANYGSSGQVLTSGGSGAAPSWAAVPPGGNTFTAVANGAIANNKAVKIDTDGKVSQIGETVTNSSSMSFTENSSTSLFTGSGGIAGCQMLYHPTTQQVVAVYKTSSPDVGVNYNGSLRAKVATVASNGALTWGSTYTLGSSSYMRSHKVCYDPDQDHFIVVAYNHTGSKDIAYTKFTVGSNRTIGGWGSTYYVVTGDATSGDPRYSPVGLEYDTNTNKYVLVYVRDVESGQPDRRLYSMVGTWNTSISVMNWGSRTMLSSSISGVSYGSRTDMCFDSTANKMVLFTGMGSSAIVIEGTVSGTSCSWGNLTTVESNSIHTPRIAHDSSSGRNILVYMNNGSTKYVGVRTLKVNSGSSPTLGSLSYLQYGQSGHSQFYQQSLVYDSGLQKCVIAYTWETSNGATYAEIRGATIESSSSSSGVTIALHAQLEGASFRVDEQGMWRGAYDPVARKHVFSFFRLTNTQARTMTSGTQAIASNLTDANHYVGFADQAYTNGQTATIKTYGNTVDTLSGLTIGTLYYLKGDGTVATSSNFSSFATNTPLAGTALSATKLLIRDPLAKT